jgi:hypothetical protein
LDGARGVRTDRRIQPLCLQPRSVHEATPRSRCWRGEAALELVEPGVADGNTAESLVAGQSRTDGSLRSIGSRTRTNSYQRARAKGLGVCLQAAPRRNKANPSARLTGQRDIPAPILRNLPRKVPALRAELALSPHPDAAGPDHQDTVSSSRPSESHLQRDHRLSGRPRHGEHIPAFPRVGSRRLDCSFHRSIRR